MNQHVMPNSNLKLNRRAHLVALTRRGQDAFSAATNLQAPWANALAKGITPNELAAASRTLKTLNERLDSLE